MFTNTTITNEKSRLYLWDRFALFFSHFIDVNPHRHHALQLTFAINAPLMMRVKNGLWNEYKAVVIDADVPHQMRATEGQQIFLYFDRESIEAHKIQNTILAGKQFAIIQDNLVRNHIEELISLWNNSSNCKDISTSVNALVQDLTGDYSEQQSLDPRIQRAISIISETPDFDISLEQLAERIYLSPSRLLHLFTEQVGVPIRQYILWRKISTAILALTQGTDLTRAALHAGFSDLPHFSRTFSRMFGISPSEILKNSNFVQVIPCLNA
jgi:AraC-like DNA-binding protein